MIQNFFRAQSLIMLYESENEYTTSYYRCIDPIENFRIKVLLKPVKNPFLPLPQFNADELENSIPVFSQENYQQDLDEYIFQWQEKVFSRNEFKKIKESHEKKKLNEKYCGKVLINPINKKNPQRLFTYVDVDDYMQEDKRKSHFFAKEKFNQINKVNSQKIKNFEKISKAKIVNYYPTKEKKNESDTSVNKFVQKMFIMIDLSSNHSENDVEENHEVLCSLSYNTQSKLFEITPSFSKSKNAPYVIGISNQDRRNFFYYWLIHASSDISVNSLRKEVGILTKVLNHQNEFKKLLIGTEFTAGLPNHRYVTLLGEIVSGEDFEYDYLHVRYHVKLPDGWQTPETESLTGVTHTSRQNSEGMVYFSHLFEITISVNVQIFEVHSLLFPEIIFEVLSIDKYNRYRNEGYSYIHLPNHPGIFKYNLRCWRATDKKIKSELERFFIGGGPELEDVAYVGLSSSERAELISRFGFVSRPSGQLYIKLNILHHSEALKINDSVDDTSYQKIGKLDTDTLLSNINNILEAFRKARARMLEAREGLDSREANGHLCDGFSKKVVLKEKEMDSAEG